MRPPDAAAPRLWRLATRGSRLALAQAGLAADAVRAAGLGAVAIVPLSTVGDRDRRRPFAELGERGIFTREIEQALLDGRADVAIHSAKDLTGEDARGLVVAAVLPRADARDAWCGPHRALDEVPPGARVGTGSVRRTAQLRGLRPDLVVEGLRGNVDTRLRKRRERGLDAIVLAACGLDRLELTEEIGFRLEPEQMLPEAGQGFIALQCRDEDARLLAAVGDAVGLRVLQTERLAVARLGGGCRTPVAAHALPLAGGRLHLRGWMAEPDGGRSGWSEAIDADVEQLVASVTRALLAGAARP